MRLAAEVETAGDERAREHESGEPAEGRLECALVVPANAGIQ
jgi:hypothetical protein